MISNKMECEDIIQEVFIKLFRNLNDIKNKNSINYWLFKTARNQVYTYYRGKKIKVDQFNVSDTEGIEIPTGNELSNEIELKETKEIILNELDQMPVEQKDIFLLKEYSGFSYKEIAELFQIDVNLVKSRLYKTRQKLINRISKKF